MNYRLVASLVACTSVDLTANTFTKASHGLLDGDAVQFTTMGTVTGISAGVNYFVINSADNTFKVSASYAGAAVDIAGTTTTPPTYQSLAEPLTYAEAKVQCKIDHDEEQDLLLGLIRSARQMCEEYCWRALLTQTWDVFLDRFNIPMVYPVFYQAVDTLLLPKGQLQSIEYVKYYDAANELATLAAGQYQVDTVSEPGRVRFLSTPSTYDRLNAVQIRYACGYGNRTAVPGPIKDAMKLMIANLYKHREDVITGTIATELPMGSKNLLNHYRLNRF